MSLHRAEKLADVSGAHALDLAAHPPPPFLVNALSGPVAL